MFRLLLLFSFVSIVFAQFTYEYQEQKEDGHLECTDEEGEFRKLGEIWTERRSCTQKRCLTSVGDKAIVQIQRCPKLEESENCTIKEVKGKDFPDCCPTLHCKH